MILLLIPGSIGVFVCAIISVINLIRKKSVKKPMIVLAICFVVCFVAASSGGDSESEPDPAPSDSVQVIEAEATQEPALIEETTATPTPTPTATPTTTPEPTPPEATTESKTESKPLFTTLSNDTIGATHHTVVGGDIEPSGTYTVVCTSGHGAIIINDKDLFVFAADEYLGTEYSGLVYAETAEIVLQGNDYITARAYNSSEFKLEFYCND